MNYTNTYISTPLILLVCYKICLVLCVFLFYEVGWTSFPCVFWSGRCCVHCMDLLPVYATCDVILCAWNLFGLLLISITNHYCLSQCYKDNEGESPSPPSSGKKGKSNKFIDLVLHLIYFESS